MIRHRVALVLVVLSAAASTGCGGSAGSPNLGQGTKLVLVTMTDHRFSPDAFTFSVGDSVTFRFVNAGTVRHEAVIGDAEYQAQHARAMAAYVTATTAGPGRSRRGPTARRHPGMTDPNAVLVEVGMTGEIGYSFARPGTIFIECHEPGHLEAGMQATIEIRAAAR